MIQLLLLLALVQGITEFLPVSSSGHLVIFEQIPFIKSTLSIAGEDFNMLINVALHVATLVAVILYLRHDILRLITGAFKGIKESNLGAPEIVTIRNILVASIPAGLAGIFLRDFFSSLFASVFPVFLMLILNGLMLIATKKIRPRDRYIYETGIGASLFIGIFQALAIMPGISRSGSTIAGGMFGGLEPEESARFSFFMAIPVIAGAGLLEGVRASQVGYDTGVMLAVGAAMIMTIIVALVSIHLLFAIVRKVRLDIFGYYTILVGVIGIIAWYSGLFHS